jgi:MraZ protein
MFQGRSALSLDAKGRLSVPTRHRDALMVQCEGRLTITRHPHGCLLLFPRPAWELVRERIAAGGMDSVDWRRFFLGNAMDVELDTTGRILVPPELRQVAGLDKNVVLMGIGGHFELWDAARLAAREDLVAAGPLPATLADLAI